MCHEAFDDCLTALKFIADWFVTSKVLEKFHDTLHANDVILLFDEECSKVTLLGNQMGILGVDLDKINLDDDINFDEDDPEAIIHIRSLAWRNKSEKLEAFKKNISK